ncbi:MAG: 3-deoxy-7-phosphoheptulonate synthase [Spirochaetaceae bacterium]|nr:3-deoxy-7-phosphoheptulonate synthase [Spirochaetaceae bacterium]
MDRTNDLRILGIQPLAPPRLLKEDLPITEESAQTVVESRKVVDAIIDHSDPRMLAVVGPCSIHDRAAAIDYANRLNQLRREIEDRVFVVMRVYFEKPRTRLGWRGLILDPHLDGTYDIQFGLHTARSILLEITGMGLPVGGEMLDPIVPQYTSDLLSWASIGARTAESQTHREMASGLSMPVGFKNGTDGSVETAIDALSSSRGRHSFIGIDQDGQTAVFNTSGNEAGHIILRGGRGGPNYHDEFVEDACRLLNDAGFPSTVMIDCSHSNSLRRATRQEKVLQSVIRQRREGQTAIIGFMLESNLREGNQPPAVLKDLEYGISITDACMGWEQTERTLRWAHEELSREPHQNE